MSDKIPVSTLFLLFVGRVSVGLLFAYAGFMKLTEPTANFEAALSQYPILPQAALPLIAAIVPWFEWILGSFLIVGYLPRISSGIAALMLVSFIVLIATGPLFSGKESESCGCFGKGGLKFSAKTAFIVDLAACIISIILVRINQWPISLHQWLIKRHSFGVENKG